VIQELERLIAFIFKKMAEHALWSKKWKTADLSYLPPEFADSMK
jgi:hypothetical protein